MIRRNPGRDRVYRNFLSSPVAREQTIARASSGSISVSLLLGAILLHAAFPKSGFKWHGIPFTIPDIVYAGVLVAAFFRFWRPFRISRQEKACALLMSLGVLFLGFRILYERYYGYRRPSADDLASLTALCVYPLILFAMLVIADRAGVQRLLYQVIRFSIVVILLYGVAQKTFGEYAVVIPGLTANVEDAEEPDFLAQKYNVLPSSGDLKLTSTYQNGNNLGINLLLLLPLGIILFRRRSSRFFLSTLGILEVGLAASRSAWAGAVCLLLLAVALYGKRWVHRIALLGALVVCISLFVAFVPVVHYRVLSSQGRWEQLGGRMEPAAILWEQSFENPHNDVQTFLFGPHGYTAEHIAIEGGGAYEMFYLALYQLAGWIGVLLWLAPVAYSMSAFYRHRADPVLAAVFLGVSAWLFAAIAEGGFWAPPTAFNLWMVIGVGWLRLQLIQQPAKEALKKAAKLGFSKPALAGLLVKGADHGT